MKLCVCTLHHPRFFCCIIFVFVICACVCVSLISGALCARAVAIAPLVFVFLLFLLCARACQTSCASRNVRQFSKYRKSAARVFFLLLSACVFMRGGGRFVYTPSNELPVVCMCGVGGGGVQVWESAFIFGIRGRLPYAVRVIITLIIKRIQRLLLLGIITF